MSIMRSPLADLLAQAGVEEAKNGFYYQDYLYQLLADGGTSTPVTEQQWELICDMQSGRKLIYASNVKWSLANLKEKRKRSETTTNT